MDKTTICLCGRELPFRVTMGAMLRFHRLTGVEAMKMDSNSTEQLLAWIYCCVQSACKAEGVEFTTDFETFCDQLTPQDVEQWNALMAEQNAKKK